MFAVVNTHHVKKVLIATLLLAGCASNANPVVSEVNAIAFPVNLAASGNNGDAASLQPLYRDNKRIIDQFSTQIRKTCIDPISQAEVLNIRSQARPAFDALTKLEQFGELNEMYLKQQNKDGLMQINTALKPLILPLS
ncbi:hypothetical protein [Serratia odorifera]|nr:hypothetical protein [Serratia odorifera]MBJ2064334.1 hypothetical protein [Serratia odorifera]PNK89752.1 hypothetical protein CEQ31_008550 [Serratia odorifera]RII70664.1 hypothetical protein DX901_17770 [Serratia odorifera]VDZ62229.1 Uncharacterised protein [Serratia odorifera]HEJ9093999.1 hypothetical protein [Serratia odorifera]